MNEDTLKRFGDILKLYSEQFEMIFEDDASERLVNGITFMEDYPLRMKQVVDDLLNLKEETKMTIQDFINKGITVVNDMGELRKTSEHSIVFPNGRVASIVTLKDGYSVATCDYEGYFDWNVLKLFGTEKGTIICKTEDEVCKALGIIESLN